MWGRPPDTDQPITSADLNCCRPPTPCIHSAWSKLLHIHARKVHTVCWLHLKSRCVCICFGNSGIPYAFCWTPWCTWPYLLRTNVGTTVDASKFDVQIWLIIKCWNNYRMLQTNCFKADTSKSLPSWRPPPATRFTKSRFSKVIDLVNRKTDLLNGGHDLLNGKQDLVNWNYT